MTTKKATRRRMDEANEHNEERPCVSQKYSSRTREGETRLEEDREIENERETTTLFPGKVHEKRRTKVTGSRKRN
jgi:hypothetical protein